MTHRPYPNRARALRMVDRHAEEAGPSTPSRPATPLEIQAGEAVVAIGRAVQLWRDALVRTGAPREAPLAGQMLHVAMPQARAILSRSAPGVLVLADAIRRQRLGVVSGGS